MRRYRLPSVEANLVHLLVGPEKVIQDRLWAYLATERRKLRLVCRALDHIATRHVGQLFRQLYVRAPVPDKDINVVRVAGPLCHHFTITIADNTDRATSEMSTASAPPAIGIWVSLISSFHQLRTLTLRVRGPDHWITYGQTNETLVLLRVAVEQNRLPELRELCLSPIHIQGIMYLCWYGFGTFGRTSARQRIWKQLGTLDLRIRSPFASIDFDHRDRIMFNKVLYNYLRSFCKTLRVLRIVWLGLDGPSPMMLHNETGLEGRLPINWPRLNELSVGNISLPFQTINTANEMAPALKSLKILRSTHRESACVTPSDSSAWIEVKLEDDGKRRHSRASSVYSQRSEESVEPSESVSRSSRSIVVYKDF